MADGDTTTSLRAEAPVAGGPTVEGGEVHAASGRAGDTTSEPLNSDQGTTPRPAPESAAPAGAVLSEAEELSALAGEEPPDPAAGFYIVLGCIVAALLLVLWLTRAPQEAPETSPTLRFPPAAAIRSGPRRLSPPLTSFRAPASPLFRRESAPGPFTGRSRAFMPGSPASARPVPGEPGEPAAPGPAGQVSAPPVGHAGSSPGGRLPLSPFTSPGGAMPPLPSTEGAAAGPRAPGPARPGAAALPGAADTPKAEENRFPHPPSVPPPTPALPDR